MEGWDAHRDGSPSELTLRRWRNFGLSGAKLIWGGEAAAVQPDGRANPHQTLAIPANSRRRRGAAARNCSTAHRERFGRTDDLLVGLQLTHSGRFCRPNPDARTAHRLSSSAAGREVRHRSGRRLGGVDGRRTGATDRQLRRGRRPGAGRGLSVRRHQGVPRLLAARIPQRPRAAGQVRRRFRGPHAPAAHDHHRDARRRIPTADRRAAERLRHAAVPDQPRGRAADGLRSRCCPTSWRSASMPDDPLRIRPGGTAAVARAIAGTGRGRGEPVVRQSLLQPAHPAAGHVSAQRRLPASRRSAGRRRPADPGGAAMQGSVSRICRWWAPPTPTCKTTCRTSPRP